MEAVETMAAMADLIILKLGGSVITDKAGNGGVDYARINKLAREIAERKNIFPIIVHGAGSCGHPEAKEHHIHMGLDANNKAGIFITHRAVCGLNDAVVNALRASGVESVGIHPLDACTAKNGRLISFQCGQIELLVRHGIVPVLHGDVVMDEDKGVCIVSGDQLISYLASHIRAKRIGLATDVAGLLRNGSVVRRITPESVKNLDISSSGSVDVTGGMKGKIDELLLLSEKGIESNIFHVSRVGDFLDGRDHGGTVVAER